MTPETCRNGTERCAAVAARPRRRLRHRRQPAGRRAADPALVRLGAGRRRCRPTRRAQVATPVLRCDAAALAGFLEDRRHGRVGATTAVFDRAGRALYFSKEVIPYTGRPLGAGRGDPGLPPRRGLRLPPGGARGLCRLAGRAARDLGGARAAALHGERRRRCTASRSRRAAGRSGSSTTRPTCRGSRRSCASSACPERVGSICRRATSAIVFPKPAIRCRRAAERNDRTGVGVPRRGVRDRG